MAKKGKKMKKYGTAKVIGEAVRGLGEMARRATKTMPGEGELAKRRAKSVASQVAKATGDEVREEVLTEAEKRALQRRRLKTAMKANY